MDLLTPASVRALLDEHGIHPKKSLGQHFLADPNTARRVAALAAVQPGDAVVEIGPGLGSLTLALVERGARVLAVEVDTRLAEALPHEEPDGIAHVLGRRGGSRILGEDQGPQEEEGKEGGEIFHGPIVPENLQENHPVTFLIQTLQKPGWLRKWTS